MHSAEQRLTKCFTTVFAGLSAEQARGASQETLGEWDSVSTLTLMSLINEEFGIEIDFDQIENLTSFEALLGYVKAS